jgi:hypothetical protein
LSRSQGQAGLVAQAVIAAVTGELLDNRIDAGVLPDEGVVEGLAGPPIPDQRGLALIGDADGGEVLGR